MDRKVFGKGIVVSACLVLILVMLSSCSVVFEAGISGRVVTTDGTSTVGVGNVNVFAYTDKGLRDADFAKFQAGQITRPSDGAGYVATTTTNANGDFTVNKIVWETKRSDFGKTADVDKLYLIFYNKNYKPDKADATIISGSTNSSNVYKELESNKDYATINVTVKDVSTGLVMTSPCTLEYWIGNSDDSDTIVVTGNTSFQVSFEKGTHPSVKTVLTAPGSEWKMTYATGVAIPTSTDVPVDSLQSGTRSVTLYMKNYEIAIPGFYGNLDSSSVGLSVTDQINSIPSNELDSIPVWLEYKDTIGLWHTLQESKNSNNKTYSVEKSSGTNILYLHGQFSNVGNSQNYSIVINENSDYSDIVDWSDFTGKTLDVTLRVVFNNEGTLKYSPEFKYSSLSGSSLGNVVWESSTPAVD